MQAVAQKIRMLRDHGQAKKYYHDIEGYNGRLDAIQAGIPARQARHLTQWNDQRRAVRGCYMAELLAPLADRAVSAG